VADSSAVAAPRLAPVDEVDDVVDASAGAPPPTPSVIERLAQAFPGAELVEGRD
jgi:hypothetical protein